MNQAGKYITDRKLWIFSKLSVCKISKGNNFTS